MKANAQALASAVRRQRCSIVSSQTLSGRLDLKVKRFRAAGEDNAMTRDITGSGSQHLLEQGWSTPPEAGVRGKLVRFGDAGDLSATNAPVRDGAEHAP
jgi:hypothetical protein